jgi:hypothetical protein
MTPGPSECHVAPRTIDEVAAILKESPATGAETAAEESTPGSIAIPLGTPTDAATRSEITGTVREFAACLAAGDALRMMGLLSDQMIRSMIGLDGEDTATESELRSWLGAEAQELPENQRTTVLAMTNVSFHSDGRASAIVAIDDPTAIPAMPAALFVFFVKEGDRWLIDHWIEFDQG